MRGSLVAAGSTVAASLALVEEAKAEADIPSWLRVPGEPVRSYGQPAETEADVKRALIQIYKDLAPAYGFSGTPLQKLRGTITPNGLHFEVHHGGRPLLNPVEHRLIIHGLVNRQLKFDVATLERYPMVTGVHFIECAGNSFFNAIFDEPKQLGCDMLHGLVSNSEWTGVPLRLLLEEAAIKPDAKWVIAMGNDSAQSRAFNPNREGDGRHRLLFIRTGSASGRNRVTRCAWFCRFIQGNMNIKWVTSLQVTSRPAYTKDKSGEYTDILADGKVLDFAFTMGVKSVITHPSGTMSMSGPGVYEISGLAWSGLGKVARVEGVYRRRQQLVRCGSPKACVGQGYDSLRSRMEVGRKADNAVEPRPRRGRLLATYPHRLEEALRPKQLQSLQRHSSLAYFKRWSGDKLHT